MSGEEGEVQHVRRRVDEHGKRLSKVEQRVSSVETYMDEHSRRLENLDHSIQHLDTTVTQMNTVARTLTKVVGWVGGVLTAVVAGIEIMERFSQI